MTVFRICRKEYRKDLSGNGAKLYGGRWNSEGNAVLYTAENRSLAALEVLAHMQIRHIIPVFYLVNIELPEGLAIKEINPKNLPNGWQNITDNGLLTHFGDEWLSESKYPILKVPFVIIPEEHNILINPLHPACKGMKVISTHAFVFDQRLFQKKQL